MQDRPKQPQAETPSVFRSAKSSLPLVWELVRPRRGRLALGLVLLLVSRASGLVVPYAPKLVIDDIVGRSDYDLIPPLFAALLCSLLIQAGTTYALSQLLALEAQRLVTEMRCRVQAHISRLPVAFFDTNKTGLLVSRVMNDVTGIRNLVGQSFVELIGSMVTAAFVVIILLHISVLLTAVTVVFLSALSGFLTWSFRAIRPLFRESARIASEVSGRLVETFGGIRLVKGYRAEAREDEIFASGAQRLLKNATKSITLGSVMGTMAVLDVRLLSAVILCLGAEQVLAQQITAGSLFSFIMYLTIVVAPITQMASVGTELAAALAGLDRTREVLAEQPEDRDPDRTIAVQSVKGHIEFQGVTFEYQPGKPVLRDVTFEARPNTVTALVGSSGSGKSTIVALVAAFYKPRQGRVLVDGTDLGLVRIDTYRPALGMVPQESFLFDGTIRENIVFSSATASEEEFQRACHIAHVDEFVERFEKKYETTIGERGVRLAGGQRQRISIARAILADPKILILDEATSSLDSESEAFIQDGLRYLMKGRTTFVIAHRLSTAREADQILVMEHGRIIETGTHASLCAQRARYFQLYSKQHDVQMDTFERSDDSAKKMRSRLRAVGSEERTGPDDGEHRILSELL